MGACCGSLKRLAALEETLNTFKDDVVLTQQALTTLEGKTVSIDRALTDISGQIYDVKGDCEKVFVVMEKVPSMARTLEGIRKASTGVGSAILGVLSFGLFSQSSAPADASETAVRATKSKSKSKSKPSPSPENAPISIDKGVLIAMSTKAQSLYQEGKRQKAYELFLDCYKKCSEQLGEDDTNTLNCKAWAAHIESEIAKD